MDRTPDHAVEHVMTRRRALQLLGYGSVALTLGSAGRLAAAGDGCKTITGTQHDVLVSDGCTSPVGFCAAGTFKGNHGYQGTTFFSALSFDPIPSDPVGRLAVPGESTYTTKNGKLTVSDVSTFDVEAGRWPVSAGSSEAPGSSPARRARSSRTATSPRMARASRGRS